MSSVRCHLCKKTKQKNAFSNSQIKKPKGQRKCKKCIKNQQNNSNASTANKNKINANNKSNKAPLKAKKTILQKLHNHCIGKCVFTEIYLAIEINKKNEFGTQKSLEKIFKDITDTFVYHNRIIIASNESSHQSKIYNALITNVPLEINHKKTRYLLNELIYPNGIISTNGVTFCDQNKTIHNTNISLLFDKKSVAEPIINDTLDEFVIFGYFRAILENISENILLICLSYYKTVEEFSMCSDLIKIINKTKIEKIELYKRCCAFGTVPIHSNSENHYQWTLYIHKMDSDSDFCIGITSKRKINELFMKKDYPNYAYGANGLVSNCNKLSYKHKGKTLRFSEGDTILMDLDCSIKQLTFVINGKHKGCVIENIVCGPIYYLGVCMNVLYDSISIKRFNWFNHSNRMVVF